MTFVFTALFTFRYYLLHTRVGLGQVPEPVRGARGGRTFWFGVHQAYVGVQAAVDELDAMAEPGDRLLVGPLDLRRTWYSDTVLYWMFPELEPATYFMEMDPGLANEEGSSLADDVASADWVLLTGLWDGWYEPNDSIEYGSDEANQVLRDPFCEVGSYEDGHVLLLRRCEALTRATPAAVRRQTAPGRWRNTLNTGRSVAGTHTVRRPRRERLHGRVGDGGGRRGERRRLHPLGHLRVDEAGAHDEHAGAGPGEGVAEALGEPVEPGLRRAVDEVRLADPLAGDARQHDEAAVALAAELGGDGEAAADRAGVVDRDHRRRPRRIGVELGLVDELPEGDDDDVEVAVAVDEVGDERLVGVGRRRRRSAPCRP